MRVIAGKYKGRILKGPKHEGLRPTADRIKEALFNIISPQVDEADFLDLFAGSGAIGIEALSRNAKTVVFSDANPASIQLLKNNIHFLDPSDSFRIIGLPVERTLAILGKELLVFDLIFLDPPFQAGLLPKTIELILKYHLLKDNGILIIEHPRQLSFNIPSALEIQLTRDYGGISLTLLKQLTMESCSK
ncbi:MAG TPA: 16S rRNA (guanine(966)-N(2))-methyltransferase RsmD [Firmicutes bacterium]|jgi:16S rRNA (guanine966-N2)-methyltransferase|nr:16S rRNA (guanine(966)-N(2))-methyltransferase RsmD [Bacillota bacterium]